MTSGMVVIVTRMRKNLTAKAATDPVIADTMTTTLTIFAEIPLPHEMRAHTPNSLMAEMI